MPDPTSNQGDNFVAVANVRAEVDLRLSNFLSAHPTWEAVRALRDTQPAAPGFRVSNR